MTPLKKHIFHLAMAALLCSVTFFASCTLEEIKKPFEEAQEEEQKTKRNRTTEVGTEETFNPLKPSTTKPQSEEIFTKPLKTEETFQTTEPITTRPPNGDLPSNDPLDPVGFSYQINEQSKSVTITGIGSYQNTDLQIPDTVNGYPVTKIEANAFENNKNITSVILPNTITSIGEYAFSNCEKLVGNAYNKGIYLGSTENPYLYFLKATEEDILTLTLHKDTKFIGTCAFQNCSTLKSVTIPSGVTRIGKLAFSNCCELTSITLPDSLTSIGQDAFEGCQNLRQTENGVFYVDRWAIGYSDDFQTEIVFRKDTVGISDFAFWAYENITTLNIPEHLIYIGECAFWSCGYLTSVTVSGDKTNIGESAFWSCDNLTSVTVLGGETTIGKTAFLSCGNLKNVTLFGGTTNIESFAFWGCESLTSIAFLGDTVNISNNAFWICENLKDIYYIGTPEDWAKLNIHSQNEELFSATLYYYSETQPTDHSNSYWHYLNDIPTPW